MEYKGSCHYISPKNVTLPCEAFEYELTDYHSTIITDVSYQILHIRKMAQFPLDSSYGNSGIWCAIGDGWQPRHSPSI